MRTTMRQQNRWFTAVAMTCLSGFALCGCTRGSRDLSSNLPESAGREAIEAERHVAERKRSEMAATKSKDLLASKERTASPSRTRPSTQSRIEDRNPIEKSAIATSQARKKPSSGRVSVTDTQLETAEWAGDPSDRKVKTVSEEREAEGVEVAEPLLDSPKRGMTAAELFEEEPEASVRVRKPTSKESQTGIAANEGLRGPRPNQASFDGASDHPWAKKSPVSTRTTTPVTTSERDEALIDDEAIVSSRTKAIVQPPVVADQNLDLDDARKTEAKARVEVLVTQSKSLLKKGEYRAAYRVAQLAQRIADSENLFFAAGEEQPADLVRAVLMKIRIDDSKVAKSDQEVGVAAMEDNPWMISEPPVNVVKPVGRTRKNLPDDWAFAEWKEGSDRRPSPVEQTASADNPWETIDAESSSPPEMRIEPRRTNRRTASDRSEFPNSRPEWQSSSNEPLALGGATDESSIGIASNRDGRMTTAVHADLNANPVVDSQADVESEKNRPTRVPRPFPSTAPLSLSIDAAKEQSGSESEPLARAENWRTQDLNEVATSQAPLLIAPFPPEEPVVPTDMSNALEDTFATDIQEPTHPPAASKLWMILAAAAGAFGMLFVRRRPVPVYRSGGEGR